MRSMHKHHAKNRYIDILPTNLPMPYASRNKLEQVNKFGSVDLDHDVVKALEIVHCANDCTFLKLAPLSVFSKHNFLASFCFPCM